MKRFSLRIAIGLIARQEHIGDNILGDVLALCLW